MSTVDDPTVISRIGIGLSTKLKTEILDDIYYDVSDESLAQRGEGRSIQDGGRARD